MRIRWTEPAANDLTNICDYIEKRDRSGSRLVVAVPAGKRVPGS